MHTKEVGLELGLIFGKFFLDTEHLHYGYWPEGLPVTIGNLRQAQENYENFLVACIPLGIKTILDVGSGTGTLAHRLTGMGYEVECVSPSPFLTRRARALLGNEHCIHEKRFEDLETNRRYDLLVFSESFQYVNLERALENSRRFLTEHGCVLISDFFRTDAEARTGNPGPFRAGHDLEDFYREAAAQGFCIRRDEDITAQTAPNFALTEAFAHNLALPIKNVLSNFLRANHPRINALLKRALRKQITRLNAKYLSGERTPEAFAVYKTYRCVLLEKHAVSETDAETNSSAADPPGRTAP